MADFARVLLAVDDVLGSKGYDSYAEQARSTAESVADSDSLCVAIRNSRRLNAAIWEGSASDLLDLLTPDKPPRDWPTTPQGMGGRLTRAAPVLQKLGWYVDKLPRAGHGRSRGWVIVPPPLSEEYRAGSSATSATSAGPDTGTSDADEQTPTTSGDDRAMSAGTATEDRHLLGADDADDADNLAGDSSQPPDEALARDRNTCAVEEGCDRPRRNGCWTCNLGAHMRQELHLLAKKGNPG